MQPEFVTQDLLAIACEQVRKKKNPVALPKIRFESFHEGQAAQTMHIGPFSDEGPTIERLHDFIEDNGYRKTGKHHEIYLSDIRKAAREKWKTIIRQPIKCAELTLKTVGQSACQTPAINPILKELE